MLQLALTIRNNMQVVCSNTESSHYDIIKLCLSFEFEFFASDKLAHVSRLQNPFQIPSCLVFTL